MLQEDWLATGLAVGAPGWVISDPGAGAGAAREGGGARASAGAPRMASPVGAAWHRDALLLVGRGLHSSTFQLNLSRF